MGVRRLRPLAVGLSLFLHCPALAVSRFAIATPCCSPPAASPSPRRPTARPPLSSPPTRRHRRRAAAAPSAASPTLPPRARPHTPPPDIGQNGWTALMHTARRGHTECLVTLLNAGADLDLTSKVRLAEM